MVGTVRNNILNLGNRGREVFIVNRFRVIVSDGIIGIKMREKDRVSEHHAGKELFLNRPKIQPGDSGQPTKKGFPFRRKPAELPRGAVGLTNGPLYLSFTPAIKRSKRFCP